MIQTDIAYADSTINPTTGCDGCELWNQRQADAGMPQACYAGRLHESRLAKGHPKLYAPKFNEVRLAPGRMAEAASWPSLRGQPRPDKPWLDNLPRIIFIGDMADIFSRAVPYKYIHDEIFSAVRSPQGQRHIWLMLTKQAERLHAFYAGLRYGLGESWPANLWAGVSVTSQANASRVGALARMPDVPVRWVSIAPLLGPLCASCLGSVVRWAVFEGEAGAHECDLDQLSKLVTACRSAGIRTFIKQLGSHPVYQNAIDGTTRSAFAVKRLLLKDRAGRDWTEWPGYLRLREMPTEAHLATSHCEFKACPRCGSQLIDVFGNENIEPKVEKAAVCTGCGASTHWMKTWEEARAAWNRGEVFESTE